MKKPLLIFLLLAFSLLYFPKANACSCFPSGYDFCTSQQSWGGDLMILGKKLSDHQHGMYVEVLEVLAGQENRDTILVWGDTGWLCRTYASTFAVGDSFVFAINEVTAPGFMDEVPGEYWLNVCGVYWLNYRNGWVTGVVGGVTPTSSSMTLEDFRNLGGSCLLTGRENPLPPQPTVSVYPIPTSETLNIDWEGKVEEEQSVRVVDAMGKLIWRQDSVQGTSLQIEVGDWAKGLYFVRIGQETHKVWVK